MPKSLSQPLQLSYRTKSQVQHCSKNHKFRQLFHVQFFSNHFLTEEVVLYQSSSFYSVSQICLNEQFQLLLFLTAEVLQIVYRMKTNYQRTRNVVHITDFVMRTAGSCPNFSNSSGINSVLIPWHNMKSYKIPVFPQKAIDLYTIWCRLTLNILLYIKFTRKGYHLFVDRDKLFHRELLTSCSYGVI